MSSIIKQLTNRATKPYAEFTYNDVPLRLYKVPLNANSRLMEEARSFANRDMVSIAKELENEPINEEEWEAMAAGYGKGLFPKPKSRAEQIQQISILSLWGRLVLLEGIRDEKGNSIYEPSQEDIVAAAGGQIPTMLQRRTLHKELVLKNRQDMLDLLDTDPLLQEVLQEAQASLIPEHIRERQEAAMEQFIKAAEEKKSAQQP